MELEYLPVGAASAPVATPQQTAPKAPPAEAPPPAETPPADPADDPKQASAKRFAEIARREKAARAQAEATKAERARIAADQAAVAEERRAIEQQRADQAARAQRYKENPAAILEDHDLSFEELQTYLANNNQFTPDQKIALLAKQVEKMKEEKEAEAKTAEQRAIDQANSEAQQVIDTFKSDIAGFVEANAAEYDLIREYNSQGLIFEVVEAYYQRTGQVLTVKQAADAVENDLFAKVSKATSTPGYQKRLASTPKQGVAPQATPNAQAGEQPQFQAQPSRTLSDSEFRASTPTLLSSSAFEQDRMARALAALG